MSYKQKIEHIVEMTQQEFIDMLESRYNAKSPIEADKLRITFKDQWNNEKGGAVAHSLTITWHTEETISENEPEE